MAIVPAQLPKFPPQQPHPSPPPQYDDIYPETPTILPITPTCPSIYITDSTSTSELGEDSSGEDTTLQDYLVWRENMQEYPNILKINTIILATIGLTIAIVAPVALGVSVSYPCACSDAWAFYRHRWDSSMPECINLPHVCCAEGPPGTAPCNEARILADTKSAGKRGTLVWGTLVMSLIFQAIYVVYVYNMAQRSTTLIKNHQNYTTLPGDEQQMNETPSISEEVRQYHQMLMRHRYYAKTIIPWVTPFTIAPVIILFIMSWGRPAHWETKAIIALAYSVVDVILLKPSMVILYKYKFG